MNIDLKKSFSETYLNKRVLVTGHTGFKGSWLTAWLIELGAEVIGFSDRIPTNPSLFEVLGLEKRIEHHVGDIRDKEAISNLINEVRPDFIFHLAAQAIVSTSYSEPLETISTNVMGMANILEALRYVEHPCVAVLVTSDKCYENVEWVWGYKETDDLGGRDIYSGSKGAAEIIFHSYYWAFFRDANQSKVRIATGRAGNVIGGGDWAKDRIIADCVRSWSKGSPVEIRSPEATRPWQHVLEPLSGYLALGMKLSKDASLSGASFNFGPRTEQSKSVISLLSDLRNHWVDSSSDGAYSITGNMPFHEAGLLRLNCDKAAFVLKWEAALTYAECVELVGVWYGNFYMNEPADVYELTVRQIEQYGAAALKRGLEWTR